MDIRRILQLRPPGIVPIAAGELAQLLPIRALPVLGEPTLELGNPRRLLLDLAPTHGHIRLIAGPGPSQFVNALLAPNILELRLSETLKESRCFRESTAGELPNARAQELPPKIAEGRLVGRELHPHLLEPLPPPPDMVPQLGLDLVNIVKRTVHYGRRQLIEHQRFTRGRFWRR
jgi:hypothetical protein